MKKIAYLVFNESIFDNLIKTQVINLFKEIIKKNDSIKSIYLINFLPLTKLFQIDKYLKERIKRNRNKLFIFANNFT